MVAAIGAWVKTNLGDPKSPDFVGLPEDGDSGKWSAFMDMLLGQIEKLGAELDDGVIPILYEDGMFTEGTNMLAAYPAVEQIAEIKVGSKKIYGFVNDTDVGQAMNDDDVIKASF
jgi:hypothetical protein